MELATVDITEEGTNRANIMHDFNGFLESLKNYSMTTTESTADNEVLQLVSNVAYTSYRYLNYQYWLDNGGEDEKLAEQQHTFLKEINAMASELAKSEPLEKPGEFACDVVGFISQLISYQMSAKPKEDGSVPSRDEAKVLYDNIYKYAMESAPLMTIMRHLGGSQDTIDDYMRMRYHQHSTAATVLRTLLIDYALDCEWASRADQWEEQYNDASVYLFFFDTNCQWTADAIKWVLLSAFTYDMQSNKERKDALDFVWRLIDKMISNGEKLMRSDRRLVGQELLEKVKTIPKMDLWLLSVQCGYTMGEDESGETLADSEEFRTAYLAAVDEIDPKQTLKEPKQKPGIHKPPAANITLSEEVRNESFVKGLSDDSIEVIEHFGAEAPHLLNQYSCALEDALMELVAKCKEKDARIEELEDSDLSMKEMLTKPEVLLNYIKELFSETGPYSNINLEEELKKPYDPSVKHKWRYDQDNRKPIE